MKNKKKIKNQKVQEILSQNNSVKENNSIEMNYSVRIVFTQLKNFNKTLFFWTKLTRRELNEREKILCPRMEKLEVGTELVRREDGQVGNSFARLQPNQK